MRESAAPAGAGYSLNRLRTEFGALLEILAFKLGPGVLTRENEDRTCFTSNSEVYSTALFVGIRK